MDKIFVLSSYKVLLRVKGFISDIAVFSFYKTDLEDYKYHIRLLKYVIYNLF
jgi:hypothetical protein